MDSFEGGGRHVLVMVVWHSGCRGWDYIVVTDSHDDTNQIQPSCCNPTNEGLLDLYDVLKDATIRCHVC